MSKPSDYKHIAAWCRLGGIHSKAYEQNEKRCAAFDQAPLDAVYFDEGDNSWVTFGQCGKRTQMAIEVELNRGKRS